MKFSIQSMVFIDVLMSGWKFNWVTEGSGNRLKFHLSHWFYILECMYSLKRLSSQGKMVLNCLTCFAEQTLSKSV